MLGARAAGGLSDFDAWDALALAEAMAGLGEGYPDVHCSVRNAPGVPEQDVARRRAVRTSWSSAPTSEACSDAWWAGRSPRRSSSMRGARWRSYRCRRHEPGPERRTGYGDLSRLLASRGWVVSLSAPTRDRGSCRSTTWWTVPRWSSAPRRTAPSGGSRPPAGSRPRWTRSTVTQNRAGAWSPPDAPRRSTTPTSCPAPRLPGPPALGARAAAVLRAAGLGHPHRTQGERRSELTRYRMCRETRDETPVRVRPERGELDQGSRLRGGRTKSPVTASVGTVRQQSVATPTERGDRDGRQEDRHHRSGRVGSWAARLGWSPRRRAPGRRRCSTRAAGSGDGGLVVRVCGRAGHRRAGDAALRLAARHCVGHAHLRAPRGVPQLGGVAGVRDGWRRRVHRHGPGRRGADPDVPVSTRRRGPDQVRRRGPGTPCRPATVSASAFGAPHLHPHRPEAHVLLSRTPAETTCLRHPRPAAPPRPGASRHGRRHLRRGRGDHDHGPGAEGRHRQRDGHLQRDPARRHRDVLGRRQVGGHERRRRQGHREASGPAARRLRGHRPVQPEPADPADLVEGDGGGTR